MIVVEMKKHFQLRALEWWSAGAMTSWGFFVLSFPSMFLENPAAHALIALAPQHVWGLAAMTAGGLRLAALFVNGLWYRTPAIRWLCSMVSVLLWFLVTAAFTSSDITNMGTVIYGWLMLADMYSAFRSASDYVEAKAQQKLQQLSLGTLPSDGGSNVRSLAANRR